MKVIDKATCEFYLKVEEALYIDLKNLTYKHNKIIHSFETYNFVKKEPLALVFSCEFCEIFKNTFFFYIATPVTTSVAVTS